MSPIVADRRSRPPAVAMGIPTQKTHVDDLKSGGRISMRTNMLLCSPPPTSLTTEDLPHRFADFADIT